jgi:hypothetical protein
VPFQQQVGVIIGKLPSTINLFEPTDNMFSMLPTAQHHLPEHEHCQNGAVKRWNDQSREWRSSCFTSDTHHHRLHDANNPSGWADRAALKGVHIVMYNTISCFFNRNKEQASARITSRA